MITPSGRSRTVNANGLRHRVLSYGATGPDLLVLPGITTTALAAEFIAVALAQTHRVHVPDLRGRGGTERAAPGRYRLADYADDVSALVTALGLTAPAVVGHSLGARIAAAYSVRSRGAHGPLVLIDPPLSGPGRDPYPTTAAAFAAQLDEAYAGTTEEAVRRHYPGWPAPQLRIRAQELASCDRTAVLETHRGFHDEDFFAHWPALRPPAVLVRGEDSPVVTDAGARELRTANPRVPVLTVPAAGHMVPWDNWPGCRVVLTQFLTSQGSEP
ncbi:alpha/beta fold hydrolase [Pseudonocardia acaciae]|uniref:alpha/beta fold hydrolase n=1 Tax=Pseudonocardia acaciae TaxID=551276 RepID=UPI0004907606|nr:alpha/beta fold hydrolase [Pseudonocardia acaciae]